jgi:UDP-N-acetylmuramoylalanine--D-glutamate ligase
MEVSGKKFSIIGIARSGLAAAAKIKNLGGKVFLSDSKPAGKIDDSLNISSLYCCEFGGHSDRVLQADIIIVSPGVPLNIDILKKARLSGIELISEIELGYRLKFPSSKIICCTGSNGKSTTVSIIHHILLTCGYKSILGGNIGTPFTSYDIEEPGLDFIVLELSSFQLELIRDFKADIGVILNITPDHLDRYKDFIDYARTKFNLFKNSSAHDLAVLNFDDDTILKLAKNINACTIWFSRHYEADACLKEGYIQVDKEKYLLDDLSLAGPHNYLNIMAALLATRDYTLGKRDKVRQALSSFQSLPHRLELVSIYNGIKFINDSKATNTDAVKFALQSFSDNIHIILGGSDKGEDFASLIPYLQKPQISTYLIGDTKSRMQTAFEGKIDFTLCHDLKDAVHNAYHNARKNDIVLLSPACASYDAYKNYIQRGNSFKTIVSELENV